MMASYSVRFPSNVAVGRLIDPRTDKEKKAEVLQRLKRLAQALDAAITDE
jgi:hypothetical protein